MSDDPNQTTLERVLCLPRRQIDYIVESFRREAEERRRVIENGFPRSAWGHSGRGNAARGPGGANNPVRDAAP